MKKHVKFEENYYLAVQEANNNVTVNVTKKTNHILVVDVSGSMSSDLPLIRTQLKNKLSNLMKDGDTISIVWFSGRNDSGILKEEVEVKSLKTLTDLNDAIDRWLRPIGMTAFLKPLQLVGQIVERIKKNRPDSVFSMIFLTDGYNNDCPWNDVVTTLKSLESDITSSTFVEYGYYADTQKLTQMASILGGEKISTSDFDEYEPVFDKKISTGLNGGKKSLIEITDSYLYDFAFSVSNGSVILYNIVDGKIMVGSDIKEIYFFSDHAIGEKKTGVDQEVDTFLYAAIYVLADKLLNDDAERIFYALGDNYYYQVLFNAFGKQKLNAFKTAIKECVIDETKRFPAGRANIVKVSDNAYCLMNLFNDLGNLENCLFYPNQKDFVYNRIGRKHVATGSQLSDKDKLRLSEAKNVEEANLILEELKEKNVDLNFVVTNSNAGYPVTDLVWNEKRANLSIRIYIDGKAILPTNKFNINEIGTFRYKTYTMIKDGIVNVDKLPLNYSSELETLLTEKSVDFKVVKNLNTFKPEYIVINLNRLPIINKGMVSSISAVELAKQEWELNKLQADAKVYGYFKKTFDPKESKSFIEMLGQEAADWLKTIGITDYNGYAPVSILAESTDCYMSVNLETKIKGLSSLPKVEDVIAKLIANKINTDNGKLKDVKELKISEILMSNAIIKYQEQLSSDIYKALTEEQQKEVLKAYVTSKSSEVIKKKRIVMGEISKIKFSLILSKRWFKEFISFDENTLNLKLDGQDLNFTFDLSEKQEQI